MDNIAISTANGVPAAQILAFNNISYGNKCSFPGTGLISADPQFNNSAAGDFTLKASSPAVDGAKGDFIATTDLADASRPKGAAADIGAYERAK